MSTEALAAALSLPQHRHRLSIDSPEGHFGHRGALPVDPWLLGALLRGAVANAPVVPSGERLRGLLAHPALSRRAEPATAAAVGTGAPEDAFNTVQEALQALSLWETPAADVRLPRRYLDAHRQARIDLLCGLLGGGPARRRDGLLVLRLAGAPLAGDVAELVRSLGGWCRPDGEAGSTLSISLPRLPALDALLDPFLPADARRAPVRRPVLVAIEPAGSASTRCIAVSHPSRLYLTSDYCVTHNTAFSLNIGEHVAVDQGLPVAVFSMEMGATQLALRMVCSVGRLDQQRLRTGRLVDDDWPRLTNSIQKMQDAQLFIDETPALNALELRARARRLSRQ
ncbi:MAG: replicative DNA helicase, partial [Burkholderiales bacterium]|nr:replicative DNA helicase [Burkholderiales bacterium]